MNMTDFEASTVPSYTGPPTLGYYSQRGIEIVDSKLKLF